MDMWEHDEADDGSFALSESRLFLVFVSEQGARRAFGPYRSVQVTSDSVWVFDRDSLLRIATKSAGGRWELPDGSDRPESYRHVLTLCPPVGVTTTLLENCLRQRPRE